MPAMSISVGNDSVVKESATLSPAELRALVALLDDPDPYVQQKVAERLRVLEESMVPVLDQIRDELSDTDLRHKVTEILHRVTFPSLEVEFAERVALSMQNMKDLEAAQLMLGRFENPTMRTDLYRRQLDRMAERASQAMHSGCCKAESWRLFIHHFFDEEFFQGARKNYTNPDNSFVHKVLQRRMGIPITLSMVILFVAERLELPLYGVGMPMHFLIKYERNNESILIDPFNHGRIVSRDQCAFFLRSNGIKPTALHFETASAQSILARTLRNLAFSYQRLGDNDRLSETHRLLSVVS